MPVKIPQTLRTMLEDKAYGHVVTFNADRPGRVLLCSDGLWRYAPAAGELAKVIDSNNRHAETSLQLARRLVDWANEMGGDDNVTVAVGAVSTREGAPA